MPSIETNIALNTTEKQYYQRFVNLSVHEEPLPHGDATIRITPFDDFFLFTLFDEMDGEDTPIDLSNVGDIFINFIGSSDDIDIKNHTQVEEVNLSQGQVLFKISRSDSKKILALDNNNFYISSKMVDPIDESASDQSVLYQGLWLAADAANRTTLTSQIEDQKIEYSVELARLQDENTFLKAENAELVNSAAEDLLTIQTLQQSNLELTDEVERLSAELGSLNNNLRLSAENAQSFANIQLKRRQQLDALKVSARSAGTGRVRRTFFKQAARNLQNFTIGKNFFGGRGGIINRDLL